MYKILAQAFPNNEIRVTMAPVSGGRDPFTQDDDSTPEPNVSHDTFDSENNESPPLSLGSNSKTERSSAGYGALPKKPTRFGLNAKRQLLRCGGALEQSAPTEEVLFLTGTLPGSTEDAFRAIAAYSGYIVNGLKAWISTYVPGKYDFYVWEYQKRGALHLHYAVHVPDELHRNHILAAFRDWWITILHRVGEMAGCDMFRKNSGHTWLSDLSKVRAVAEVCKKSVARYLAKYLSKSAAPTRGSARFFTPSRWWGTSRPLKSLTAALTTTVEIITSGVQAVRRKWEEVYHACASSDGVTYCYRHNVGIGQTSVSYPATKEEYQWLITKLESCSSMRTINSTVTYKVPSQELKAVKMAQIAWLEQSLTDLPEIQTGLRNALEAHLSWTRMLTPSTSAEPLSVLLAWMAHLSDIVFICRFTSLWSRENRKQFDVWAALLEANIERVAENGWE